MHIPAHKIRTAAAVAVLAFALTACTQAASTAPVAADCTPEWTFATVSQGTLTIATVASLPYIDVPAGGGAPTGIDPQLLGEFAKRACLTPQYQSLAGPAAIAAMTEGRADVAAGGWYATPQRGEVIGQTTPVWYDFNAIVSSAGYRTIEELRGHTVGVEAGSVYDTGLTAALGDGSIRRYQSFDALVQDLQTGRIDAAVGSSSQTALQVKQRGATLTVNVLSADPAFPDLTAAGKPNYPFTKTNTALGTALDTFIAEKRSDGTVARVLGQFGLTDPKNVSGA